MIYLKQVKSKQTLDKRVQSLAHLTPLHSGTHETLHHSITYSSIFHAKIPQKVCTSLKVPLRIGGKCYGITHNTNHSYGYNSNYLHCNSGRK